jgi:putative acetyltransferase
MAVLPEFQNQRIGSAPVYSGLDKLIKLEHDVVVVLGHSDYYSSFRFKPSKPCGIQWEIDVPEDIFMVAELNNGSINGRAGIVRYHSAFKDV